MKKMFKNTALTIIMLIAAFVVLSNNVMAAKKEVVFKEKAMYKRVCESLKAQWILYVANDSNNSIIVDIDRVVTLNLSGMTRVVKISDLSGIEEFTKLELLNIDSNQVKDISILKNLKSLKFLYIQGNQVSDITVLKNFTDLRELNLGNNQITDISVVANLTELRYLYFYNNQISNIDSVANLVSLNTLYMSDNNIDNIRALENLTASNINLNNQIITRSIIESEIIEEELPQMFQEVSRNGSKVYYASDNPFEISVEGEASAEMADGKIIITNAKAGDRINIRILGGNASGSVVTYNILEEKKEDIKVTVTFEDENNKYGMRPETVMIKLFKNGEEIMEAITNEKQNFEYIFTDMPLGEYTVEVEEVKNYEASYNGYDITLKCTYQEEIVSPNTSDIDIVMLSIVMIVSIAGINFVIKNKLFNN